MSVITISREFGSEGDAIARRAAQALGYHFADQKLIGTLLGQYGYVEFNKEYETLPTFWERFDAQREKQRDVMVTMLNQVIQALAHHGDMVILGRSGFEVLGGFADVLHVRLQAPISVRIGRVMAEQKIQFEEAELIVKESDRVRRAFVEEFYRVSWGAIDTFDLVINTGKIFPDLAATWIIDAAKTFVNNMEIGKPTTMSIKVDRILEDAVSEVIKCNKVHG
jgi:cytidylate kinase